MPEPLAPYLNRLRAELAELPARRRDDEVREVAAHLRDLIEELQAQGMDQHAAVAGATERFGSAEYIGRQLRTAHCIRSPWRLFSRYLVVSTASILSMNAILLAVVVMTPLTIDALSTWVGHALRTVLPLLLSPLLVEAIHEYMRQLAERTTDPGTTIQ
jgi:hypothetical protein